MNIKNATYLSTYTQNILSERVVICELFFRLLSLIYLIAFLSIFYQLNIFNEDGIIPIIKFTKEVLEHENYQALLEYPSIFWINQQDWFIILILLLSVVISIFGLLGIHHPSQYFCCWFFYLSFVSFSRDLFLFPWDTFLLEIGFISFICILYIKNNNQLPRIFLIALNMILLRQWLSMAFTKLFYSDPTWYNLTFMKYFWVYQPSPTIISKYLYTLPLFVQKTTTLLTLIIEMSIPVLIAIGKKQARTIAFFLSVSLSIAIQIVGNFGFFNLLTITLSFWLLKDEHLSVIRIKSKVFNTTKKDGYNKICYTFAIIIIALNMSYIYNITLNKVDLKHPMSFLNYDTKGVITNDLHSTDLSFKKLLSTFKISSPHGVFKYIPKSRKILILQKKVDNEWMYVPLGSNQNIVDYRFEAPYMDRISYYIFYQPLGGVFWNYYELTNNRNYMSSFGESLLKYHYENIKTTENNLVQIRLILYTYIVENKSKTESDTIYFNTITDIENFIKK